MKIIVTGAAGMVGQATTALAKAQGIEVGSIARDGLDIDNASQVREALERARPDFVINCAAFTNVDASETEKEKAHQANAIGAENLAAGCRHVRAGLIHISTDYVFDGSKEGFYTLRDEPN